LRQAVAEHLATTRGVHCSVEQTVIVSGVQEALDVTARLMLDSGDRVCIEDPGYTGAVTVFEACGARISSVPVDEEGISVHRLPRRNVRLVYVTPGHQFPLGTTMSLGRRVELLTWAQRSGAMIFEDDYDSEYRYAGRPVPALQGLDRHGSVLYAGTFGKALFPALRLGYMVVPENLVERVEAIKSITTRHAPVLEQAILHAFLTEGHFGRHVRRMRGIYSERLGVLLEEAATRLEGLLTITGVEAGLQTAGWLAAGIDGEVAAAAAARLGVDVTPLSRYARGKLPREGLQLGFAAVNRGEIKRGIEKLARALEDLSRPDHARRHSG
jgi:GntR family transcriptional regulator / MocR family aminotransferase